MKQNPETRPDKDILDQFIGWSKVLKRSVEDCLLESFDLYYKEDHEYIAEAGMFSSGEWKTFSFEIDWEPWERFKRFAMGNYQQSRDQALSIAMATFINYHDNKLQEALK